VRIAILGTRGVPAAYGGFETFAEELGSRLVERGHSVTVYGRAHVVPKGLRHHRGMSLRVLPTVRHKYLDTVVHTAFSVVDALWRRFDIVLICNSANAPFALAPRLVGSGVALNVDGLEWNRRKWGFAGRAYYRLCSAISVILPIELVSDAEVIADYYQRRRGRRTTFIPYGADGRVLPPGRALGGLGLDARGYILYVGRLEPENNALTVIQAHARADIDIPLVVVGDAPYASEYIALLRAAASRNVMFTGYVFGEGYVELQSNALLVVQATEVGGTHPALIEAMARGATIVANDVPEHREVLGDAGVYFERNDPDSLASQLLALISDEAKRNRLGAAARERARADYSWDHVTDMYVSLFEGMRRRRLRG
jgi:glycosyltransferase involved in cell wall biosynthesis